VTHLDALGAVLHVDPVIDMVPHTLNAKVAHTIHGVGETGERLHKEALRHLPLAVQHKHPGVDSQTIQRVWWWLLKLLQAVGNKKIVNVYGFGCFK